MKPVQDSSRRNLEPTNTYTLINKEHLLTHEDRVREEKNNRREVLVHENYEPVSPKPSEILREI